ncbi:MAG TPA: flagellar hook capping FlgD N-terminal domain-containing protein [Selenomonadales bacterium]|nr:flagellar hook capping FlgD N-terminal domain-containing protein [Selenomonadales bacterium]
MSTSAVSSTSSATSTASSTTSTTSNSTLDFNSMLELLVTELQYQDPTDPVDTSEYVNQMVGISSLQALENIYSTVGTSTAFGLIGQTVTYQYTDSSGNTVAASGVVDSVTVYSGTPYLNIDGTLVTVDKVVQVESTGSGDSTTA